MVAQFVLFVETHLIPFGSAGLFVAAILEEVIAPIPSSVVMMGGGFLFLKGAWSLELFYTLIFNVVLPVTLGVTVGSLFVYTIAYFAGKPVLVRFGKWFGLSWSDIERAEEYFKKGYADGLIIFGVRTIPIIPSVAVSALCGLVRIQIWTYMLFTFIGTFIRASALALLGWKFGTLYIEYADSINRVEDVVLYTLIFVILGLLTWRFLQVRARRKKIDPVI